MKKQKTNNWLPPSFDLDSNDDASKPLKTTSSKRDSWSNQTSKNDIYNNIKKPTKATNFSTLLVECEPKKSTELAVSRQKQQEITKWLHKNIQESRPNILILSGPTGCGKTTALKVLAKENNFEVIEWTTPIDPYSDENHYATRQGERFEDFVIRATRYSSVLTNNTRRLLLVKDIPNIYINKDQGRYELHNLLEKYFKYGKNPLVFICTEIGGSSQLSTLLAQHNEPSFHIDSININAVTQVSMKNTMKRVSQLLNLKASHSLCITADKVDDILSIATGDVRSAILNLMFSSLKISGSKSVNCVRENVLGLFHGIGRVINPKRNSETFVHSPEELTFYFHSQIASFIPFVHENYLNTVSELDDAASCVDVISLADVMSSEWKDRKLHEPVLCYCIRGVMVNNKKPISSWNPVRKPSDKTRFIDRNVVSAELQSYSRKLKSVTQKEIDREESVIEDID